MKASYKELSLSEIIEQLNQENFSRELVIEAISRNNFQINSILEKATPQFDYIKEYFDLIRLLPTNIIIQYYPLSDKFVSSVEDLNFEISDEKKDLYKSLANDENFSIELNFIKDSTKLFTYKLENKTESKKNFLTKAVIGSSIALSVALSGAMGVKQHFDNKAEAAVQEMKVSSNNSSFIESYELAMREVGKMKKQTPQLLSLNNHDLQLLFEDEQESFEPAKEDIISLIKDVISPYVKNQESLEKISEAIYKASATSKVDYMIFLSILKVETTTFDQTKVSHTGDVSIAQIKPEVWSKEFARMKRKPLDLEKLKQDPTYSIDRMGEILDILQKRHKDDPYWYARYHSGTIKYKIPYLSKLQKEYSNFREKQMIDVHNKINYMIAELNQIENSKEEMSVDNLFVDYEKIQDFRHELHKLQMSSNKLAFNE